jgi:hypothetical protein
VGSDWFNGVLLDSLNHHLHLQEANGKCYRPTDAKCEGHNAGSGGAENWRYACLRPVELFSKRPDRMFF